MSYLMVAAQAVVAAVFGAAALSKLPAGAFAGFVASTGRLLPGRWWRRRRLVAALVLVAESATVGLVVVPVSAVAGFGLALLLSGGFGAGVVGALRRGERVPCRCFGMSVAPLGPVHVVRNGLLAVVAVAGSSLAVLAAGGGVHPGGVVVAVAAGLVLAVLVVKLDDLVALYTPIGTSR